MLKTVYFSSFFSSGEDNFRIMCFWLCPQGSGKGLAQKERHYSSGERNWDPSSFLERKEVMQSDWGKKSGADGDQGADRNSLRERGSD